MHTATFLAGPPKDRPGPGDGTPLFYDEHSKQLQVTDGTAWRVVLLGDTAPSPAPAGGPPVVRNVRVTVEPDNSIHVTGDPVDVPAGSTVVYKLVEIHRSPNGVKDATALPAPASVRRPSSPVEYGYGWIAVVDGVDGPLSEIGHVRLPYSRTVPQPPGGAAPAAGASGGVRYPGADLSRWKLTIPESRDGKVVEIRPPQLAGYSSRYFERLTDGSLRFRCWHGGDTTRGSSNPRSELRERVGDDPEGYWPLHRGRHTLEVAGQINRHTRVKPHVVASQIHARSEQFDDVTVWRIEGSKLWITHGDNTHAHLVDDALALGQRYTLRTEVADGKIRYAYNGQAVPFELDAPDDVAYFKAGLYLNSNPKTAPGESTEEFAEVVIFSVEVDHSGANA